MFLMIQRAGTTDYNVLRICPSSVEACRTKYGSKSNWFSSALDQKRGSTLCIISKMRSPVVFNISIVERIWCLVIKMVKSLSQILIRIKKNHFELKLSLHFICYFFHYIIYCSSVFQTPPSRRLGLILGQCTTVLLWWFLSAFLQTILMNPRCWWKLHHQSMYRELWAKLTPTTTHFLKRRILRTWPFLIWLIKNTAAAAIQLLAILVTLMAYSFVSASRERFMAAIESQEGIRILASSLDVWRIFSYKFFHRYWRSKWTYGLPDPGCETPTPASDGTDGISKQHLRAWRLERRVKIAFAWVGSLWDPSAKKLLKSSVCAPKHHYPLRWRNWMPRQVQEL